jgi:hypothetical protein
MGTRITRPSEIISGRFMPDECVQFTLKWPVLRLSDESILDWILPEIKPLLMITLAVAQLAVKEILLPDWLFCRMRPATGRIGTPELNPLFQRRDRHRRGRAKNMQVIRHDGVTSHQPPIRFAPGIEQQVDNLRSRQQWTAFVGANGDKLEHALICKFQRSQMRQFAATWLVIWIWHF